MNRKLTRTRALEEAPAAAQPANSEWPPRGVLTSDASSEHRKEVPMCEGLIDYFPDACAYVAYVSFRGNQKHNPGEPLHWARGKSMDHADCILRHLKDRGKFDPEGIRHTGELAWRALALLQEELEKFYGLPRPRNATELPPQ